MHVALYVPTISPDWGGVWQYAQWVLRELNGVADYSVVGSEAFMQEAGAMGLLPGHDSDVCFDAFAERIKNGIDPGLLEAMDFRELCYRNLAKHLESHRTDLVHVPIQLICDTPVSTRFPYILNPHDYQHEYLPDFFTEADINGRRNVWYPTQRNASALVVHSKQTQNDAIKFLGIPEERVFYAPYGPLKTFNAVDQDTVDRTTQKFGLPERYFFYPARMWAHKNHVALVRAIAQLKRKGIDAHCVFTDNHSPYAAVVAQIAEEEGVQDRVITVGRITPDEMSALYQAAFMVVVPSLFEQNSGPMLEAIQFEKPVAVSNLPELENTLDGQGFIFDANSPAEIAEILDRFLCSDALVAESIEKIRALKARMSWAPFRDTYRRAYEYVLGS
ncbi:MAG: glycosyltransferase [Gammaproteobacteria bacterium]|nr:glycosyltransferase [Gammaproteobacteria bacterium]